jgi:hypothetical protein
MLLTFHQILVAVICALVMFMAMPIVPAYAQTNPAELAKAVVEIENLDAMRSGLASSLEGIDAEPTMQTMKEVCKPVGMRAKQLGQENGWQVKQIAKKYRNPAHAPDNLHAQIALAEFEKHPELKGFWEQETIDGQSGTRYYRRINVESSCLVCHGARSDRPQFVKDNYPHDLAYDFKAGDLRGMYAVFIPDLKAALATPATLSTPETSTTAPDLPASTNSQSPDTATPPETTETSETATNSEISEPQQSQRHQRRQRMRQRHQNQQRQCDHPDCMKSADSVS